MGPSLSPFSSSARRRPPAGSRVLVWVIGFLVVVFAVLVFNQKGEEATPVSVPIRTVVPFESPTPVLPTPTPMPFPTPILIPEATPTPKPTPTPTPTRRPIPTRRPRRAAVTSPRCIDYGWTISPNTPGLGHNFVEISVTNRCSRDLEPDELWFEVSGWRDGGLVQVVRAKPFDRVTRGRMVTLALDLPGSVDWYDEIRVEWDER